MASRLAFGIAAVLLAACVHQSPVVDDLDGNSRVAAGDSSAVEARDLPVAALPAQHSHPPRQQPAWRWRQPGHQQLAEAALLSDGGALLFAEPRDIHNYCPAWQQLDNYQRLSFWADLLAAMAVHESSHNPAARHTERFNDRFGVPVVSRGLLQLSQESANGYGCNIRQAAQLHSPAENIRCAVRIMSRWVSEDGVISDFRAGKKRPWRGGARYWSVLRANAKTADIQRNLRTTALCRLSPRQSVADSLPAR